MIPVQTQGEHANSEQKGLKVQKIKPSAIKPFLRAALFFYFKNINITRHSNDKKN